MFSHPHRKPREAIPEAASFASATLQQPAAISVPVLDRTEVEAENPGLLLPPSLSPSVPIDPAPPEIRDPAERVARANAAARIEPTRDGYANAVQVYAFDDGALFQVYAAPGQITDIALQPGETLSASGPVAAGDTTRWIIGDTLSGSGATARVHILVKPTRPALRTNLIINLSCGTQVHGLDRHGFRIVAVSARGADCAAEGDHTAGDARDRAEARY